MAGLVLAAAGRGSRFTEGPDAQNKVWALVGGRPLLEWSLAAFQEHEAIRSIVIVGAASEIDRIKTTAEPYSKVSAVVTGGSCRAISVRQGLQALPAECIIALVHDAARPAVSPHLIDRVVEGARTHGAAVPGLVVRDTVKRIDPDGNVLETVPRQVLRTVQTPQAARRQDLLEAYERLGALVEELTDEAAVLEAAGYPVHVVAGEESNLKVTVLSDIAKAEAALGLHPGSGRLEVRTGFGYDVHPFAEGRDLWLGGVLIPHARGLKGHSDADALLHAVCDALLGAAGMGDIGVLFPDTDEAHKDRASREFLGEVRRQLQVEGWQINNVDVALLAEEPRIGPFRAEMCSVIAEELHIHPSRINVKATTSEGMGFVGRREGIACWAVATLQRVEQGSTARG